MPKISLYKESAKYYDLVYHWKDYKKESKKIIDLAKKYKKSDGNGLLDVACGTGNHIKFLKQHYNVAGIDINKHMLKIARKKFPKIKFYKGDMRNFNLNKKFDIVVCLFSAIGHLLSNLDIKRAISAMSSHLNEGGLIVIEPFIQKKYFVSGKANMETYNGKDIKISRHADSYVNSNIVNINLYYLISEKNKKVQYFVDKLTLNMFPPKKYLFYMKKAHLKASFLKNGLMKDRGLFIGVKQ